MSGRRAVDEEREQLGPAVVPARVHELFAPVDQCEVEVGDHSSLARADGLAQQSSIGRDDRSEAAAGDRADAAAGVLHDLRLLIGIQPGRGADHEARRLEGMLPDVDVRLLGKQVAEDRARVHRRVDLLAVSHHRVARQRVVVLPARELADAADRAIHRTQTRAVALTPDHTLVIGRRDLATPLNQRAVGVEEELRVVQGFSCALVHADGNDHARRSASVGNRVCSRGRHRYGLQQ